MTEPTSGSDTTSIQTFARREGDEYVINGQKIWTSRAEHSDLMLLLARTTPRDQARSARRVCRFSVDMRQARTAGLSIRPIRTMMNHSTTEVFFDDVRIRSENVVGEEGDGFRYILSGMNAERILIAAECVGDAKWPKRRPSTRTNARSSAGRSTRNRGFQFSRQVLLP